MFVKIKNIAKSEFSKNALILTIGSGVAQLVPIFFYPILGRMFTPREFGLLATLAAITSILSIVASGMYEGSILISDTKNEAANIVGFILYRSLLTLTISYIILQIFAQHISKWFNEPDLCIWIFVTPLTAFATVIYNCFNEWCVTNKYFINLTWNKLLNTVAVTLGKVGCGVIHVFGNGLIMGDLFGKLLTACICLYKALSFDKAAFKQMRYLHFKSAAKKHSHISKYLMPDQILNYFGGSIHIYFIGTYYSITELGYLSLAASLLTVPVTVISASIKDVFRQKANEAFVATGNCRHTYLRLLKPITFSSILFFVPLYFLLPSLFSIFLGSKWLTAGIYAQLLLPMFVTNFISMSLGGIFIISKKINVSLIWQIYTIVVCCIGFVVGIKYFGNIEATLLCFMTARSSAYLLYMILSYYYAKQHGTNEF